MISTIAAIGAGGAIGAVMRHGANIGAVNLFGPEHPYMGTISANILGSFMMGVLISYFVHVWEPPPQFKSFLVTGLLGAFTTFSTFSLQFVMFWERGDHMGAVTYLMASVFFAIAALMLGMAIIRWIFL